MTNSAPRPNTRTPAVHAGTRPRPGAGRPVALALWLCAILGPGAFAQAPPGNQGPAWWNDDWSCRKMVTLTPVRDRPGDNEATLSFSTLGNLREDGADIRVVDESGQEIPHTLLSMGFEDHAEIAFRATAPTGKYWVYFGNPRASAKDAPPMHGGLVLEVRELGAGRCNTYEECRRLVSDSPVVLGRGLVRSPQQGFNPFGRGTHYLALFQGWLDCPEDGEYEFATNSWDGSFLCVDGAPVAQFPGWHGPDGGNAAHAGKITLTRGPHRFEYLNAISNRGQGCAAGWRRPSAQRVEPIPSWAFLGGLVGQVARLERRGERRAADFEWRIQSDLGTDDREVTAVQFRDAGTGADARSAKYEWDFGDGVTGTGRNPLHVYLENTVYPVRLTVKEADGAASSVTMKVRVRMQTAQGVDGYERRLREYVEAVKAYPKAQLSPRANLFLGYLHYEAGDAPEAIAAWRYLFDRRPALDDRQVQDGLFLLAELYRDDAEDPDRALEVWHYLAENCKDDAFRVKAKVRSAELLLSVKGEVDAAERAIGAVLAKYKGVKSDYLRLAHIVLGDVHLARGNREKAGAEFELAQNRAPFKVAYGDIRIQEGDHAVAFAEYMERKDFTAARDEIRALEWSLPLEKLTGEPTLMRAELALAQRRFERAARELERLPSLNPSSNRLPEGLLMLGQCQSELGRTDQARATFQRVIEAFPYSIERKEAEQRLAALGR
ncbi:MAG: tetratricopeptide repeat protein [Planctomycetes bacterium]|nr:tetratricopeptide repeat protein [Planctomycetota bacterium]